MSRRSRAAIRRFEDDLDDAIRLNDPDLIPAASARLIAVLDEARGDDEDDEDDD
ncbi:hypothetical protein [Clavibacter capsici]|uniref:hypothetical protein n=1 Tax=Clavibacter capsici TaxID=1874630 RepID=UPI001427F17B|nr:hypothetical protein [Clavibacter capsici]QIS39073.1 hypothetical protein GW572_07370 [Clavibacter capsici]